MGNGRVWAIPGASPFLYKLSAKGRALIMKDE